MLDRQVTYTVRASAHHRGTDRFITHIGGPWGLAAEEDAIRDIRYGFHTYYIRRDARRVEVVIAKGVVRDFLTTEDHACGPTDLLALPHPLDARATMLSDDRPRDADPAFRYRPPDRKAAGR